MKLFPLFLALTLVVGGEYKITHSSGRISYAKITSITEQGDYVVQRPKQITNRQGRPPSIVWARNDVLLSGADISEAELIRPPRVPDNNDWNRLTKKWTPPSELR